MAIRWLFLGNIIYVALQWAIISLFTKIFSTEDVGRYFFALAMSAPLFLFFSLKLPTLIVAKKICNHDASVYWTVRAAASAFALLITLFIAWLFFLEKVGFYIVLAVALFKFLEHLDELASSFYQAKFNFKAVFNIKVKRAALYFFSVLFSSLCFDDLDTSLLSGTLMYFLIWLFINTSWLKSFGWNLDVAKDAVLTGLPLGLSVAVSSSVVSLSRVYIGLVLGNAALAVYGSIGYTITAFTLLISAMGQYYLPGFVGNKSNKRVFIKKIVSSQSAVLFLGGAAIFVSYFTAYDILKIAYNSDIASYSDALMLVILATIFKASSSLIGTAVTATDKYSFQLKFSILSAVLTAILLPLMIEIKGIYGGFLSLLLVNVVEWFGYIIFGIGYFKSYFCSYYKKTE